MKNEAMGGEELLVVFFVDFFDIRLSQEMEGENICQKETVLLRNFFIHLLCFCVSEKTIQETDIFKAFTNAVFKNVSNLANSK